jgi:Outer membrane protein beta-barrel domain
MQSVSLKKPLTFLRSARSRQSPQFLKRFQNFWARSGLSEVGLFLAKSPAHGIFTSYTYRETARIALLVAVGLPWAVPSHAQDTQAVPVVTQAKERFDFGVGGFYQVTNASNGNFIREDTTESYGPLVSFRQPYRPWLGYEANLGFTSFSEAYNKGVVKLKSNDTDLSVSYLLQSPLIYGFQPFLTLGGGIIYFSPTGTVTNTNTATPSHLSSQLLPEFTYGIGINYPFLAHLGARVQLRGLKYKTPDFHQFSLDTHTLRTTLEPTISVYYRF